MPKQELKAATVDQVEKAINVHREYALKDKRYESGYRPFDSIDARAVVNLLTQCGLVAPKSAVEEVAQRMNYS